MQPANVLILEDDSLTIRRITEILDACGIRHVTFGAADAAWRYLCTHPEIDLLVIRTQTATIDGVDFCSRVRFHHKPEELPILVLFSEAERSQAGKALAAGATDFLQIPFEPRRFRLKAAIPDGTPHRRVDPAPDASAEQVRPPSQRAAGGNTEGDESSDASADATGYKFESDPGAVRLVLPLFDSATCSLRLPVPDEQISVWEADPAVQRVELDDVMCCPACGGLPTFRNGCSCCGSAIRNPERLIHHYACAYIGAEKEFREGDRLSCPKCLQTRLVAGSDFEIVSGVTACSECSALITSPTLICQCIRCQHRFPSEEAVVKAVIGYQIPLAAGPTGPMVPAAGRPASETAMVTSEHAVPSGRSS